MALTDRLRLHDILVQALGSDNVYFRPSDNTHLKFPCIIYERLNNNVQYADNISYIKNTRYSITLIDEDPDSEVIPILEDLPMCTFDRHYFADGFNHDVFTIFI